MLFLAVKQDVLGDGIEVGDSVGLSIDELANSSFEDVVDATESREVAERQHRFSVGQLDVSVVEKDKFLLADEHSVGGRRLSLHYFEGWLKKRLHCLSISRMNSLASETFVALYFRIRLCLLVLL